MAKPNHDESMTIPDELWPSTPLSQPIELSDELHPDDGRPKTRRVNPERLASRLDPELVVKMEALIFPGAKMPSFAVRQVFQEEYNVDRRHIYDYFHSRGLRVAKEDRYTNLTRGRTCGARSKPITTQHRSKPPHQISIPRKKVFLKARPAPKYSQSESPVPLAPSVSIESPNLISPNDFFNWNSPAPGFTHPEDPPDTPLTEFLSPDGDNLGPGYLADSLIALSDLEVSLDTVLPPSRCGLGLLVDEEAERPLTEDERIQYYNLINDNIGPADGIQESTGTYSSHIKKQALKTPYLEDRTCEPQDSGLSILPNAVVREHRPTLDGTVDFQKWLLPIPLASSEVRKDILHIQPDHAPGPSHVDMRAGHVTSPRPSIKQIDLKQSSLAPLFTTRPRPSTKPNPYSAPTDSNTLRTGCCDGNLRNALFVPGYRAILPAAPNFSHHRASAGGI